jgi:hypothetical protein
VAFEVQEQALRQHSLGKPLAEVAENLTAAGGPYSEKTIWRWVSCWNRILKDLGALAWEQALKLCPHLKLPVGAAKPRSEWGWLLDAWDQAGGAHQVENLLTWFYRYRSLAAAPG